MIDSKKQGGRKPTLNQRISAYMRETQQDSKGIEKMVNERAHQFLLQQARKPYLPAQELHIGIEVKEEALKIQLSHKTRFIRYLKVSDLVDFFAYGLSFIPGIKDRITAQVNQYLSQLAQENKLTINGLNIVFVNCARLVLVEAYHNGDYLRHIPIRKLIQHFRK